MVTSEGAQTLLPEGSSAHGKNEAIEKFVLDVNQLLSSSSSQETSMQTLVTSPDFVPLRPVTGMLNAADLPSASSSATSPVQGRTLAKASVDQENFSRTLEEILDKHVEQIDQSLSQILKGDKT